MTEAMDRRRALRRLAAVGVAVPTAQWVGALPAAATGSVPPNGDDGGDPGGDLLRWTLHLLLLLFGRYAWVRCVPNGSGGWSWEIEWADRSSPGSRAGATRSASAATSDTDTAPEELPAGWVVESDDGRLTVVLPSDAEYMHGFAVAEADRREGVDNGDGSVSFDVG